MTKTARESSVSALMVGDYHNDRQLMQDLFRRQGWRLFEVRDRLRAMSCLRMVPVHVVLAETSALDFDWKRLLHDIRELEKPPQLIVTSRHADDHLWAEALNVGAYDVLAQPFECEEVERVVSSAWRHYEDPALTTIGAA